MKKSDLRDGMVIEMDDGSRGIAINNYILYEKLSDSLDDFTCDLLYKDYKKYRINKVYRIIKRTNYISEIFKTENLKLIWERREEIDWSKVFKWTKVQVRASGEDEWKNAYYQEYSDGQFKVCFNELDTFTHIGGEEFFFTQCRIHPKQEIKEEWYK